MITDPIADMLIRLRNASFSRKEKVGIPYSKTKAAILSIFKREGVVDDFKEKVLRGKRWLDVTLPTTSGEVIFPEFTRVSHPGRRLYVKAKDIPRPLKGYGLVVISTPSGILTGREARERGIGGEVLFKEC